MTPEERAQQWLLAMLNDPDVWATHGVPPERKQAILTKDVAANIRAAVAAEREAWTQVLDHGCGCNRCLDAIEALKARA